MPSRGDCSSRKMSSMRPESSYAMAQPTTPPPMMTTLTRSMRLSATSQRQEVLRALHRLFQPPQKLLQIRVTINEIDFRRVHHEQVRRSVAKEKMVVSAGHL